jgi:5-methylcytosine-specific restriction endonuclease McrA
MSVSTDFGYPRLAVNSVSVMKMYGNRERYNAWFIANRRTPPLSDDERKEATSYIEILKRDPCAYCGKPSEHVDHITAVVRGGSSAWGNLAAACAFCNQSNSALSLLRFLHNRSICIAEA